MRRTEFERSVSRPGAPVTSDYERHKSRRKMKCLVSVGLVLPALAAVIGVVAWAVSADIVMGHRNNVASPDLRLQDEMGNDAVLQDRSDVMYEGRTDGLQMIDNVDTPVSSTVRSERKEEPPYVVHVVVPQKSSTESPSRASTQSAVTDVNDFLSKIISASRGSNKILVVPFPGPLPAAVNEEDKSSRFDDDEEDNEPAISAEPITPRKPDIINVTHRPMGPQRSGEQPYGEDIRVFHAQNDGEIQHYMQQKGGGLRVQPPPQQSQLQHSQQHHNPPPRHNQPQKPHNPPKSYYQQSAPQQPPPPPPPPPPPIQQYRQPPHSRPHHPPPNFEQGTGNRAYIPKPAQHQPVPYYEAPNDGQRNKPDRESQQGYDSNRWGSVDGEGYGHEAPKGITLTFGSGPGPGYSGGGGGYHHGHHGHHIEPLSVIKSLFLPFLPKPRVNLNGRVVFGVVLEKGVGLGGNKGGGGSGVSLGGYH